MYPRPAQRVPEEPFAYQTIPFAFGGRPPYALPDSYPRWFKVLYRQPWILLYASQRRRPVQATLYRVASKEVDAKGLADLALAEVV